MEDRDQGNCELVSCPYHEDSTCILGECVLSDLEYLVEVERSEAIDFYETRGRDRKLVGHSASNSTQY